MLVIDLDGVQSTLKLTGHLTHNQNKSSLHLTARELIKKRFPLYKILEEVDIKLRAKDIVRLDFFLPGCRVAVEVQGEQHYKFNPFFHRTHVNWVKHQRRDKEKRLWLENNKITLIELPFNQVEQWETIINEAYKSG